MPRGWKSEVLWHRILYDKWYRMWSRVYNNIDYFGVLIQPKYKYLSGYVEDFQKLENFDLFKDDPKGWSIDKDIKGGKHYYFENLSLVSISENTKDRNNRKGCYFSTTKKPIIAISIKDGSFILFNFVRQVIEKGYDPGEVSKCCNNKAKSHKGYKWYYFDMNDREV